MTPGDARAAAMPPPQPAVSKNAAATGAAITRTLSRGVMRSSVLDGRESCSTEKEPLPAKSSLRSCRLVRERELDPERVVALDRLAAQQRRRVPAVLERLDHRAVHKRQALHHPAVAHHALRADHALDDHHALDLALQGLRRVLRIRARHLLRRGHGVVELDGTGPGATDLATDLPADHATHHAADNATLDPTFHALVLLDLRLGDVGRLLFHLRDLLWLDHRRRGNLRLDPLRPGSDLLPARSEEHKSG